MVAAGETMVRRSKRISHGMNEKVKKAATFSKISLPSMSGHFAFKTGASLAPNTPFYLEIKIKEENFDYRQMRST